MSLTELTVHFVDELERAARQTKPMDHDQLATMLRAMPGVKETRTETTGG